MIDLNLWLKLWHDCGNGWEVVLCREEAMFLFLCVLFCLYRNYMNDSLRTNVFVRFQAETIACACIFLAARALQVRGTVCLKHLHYPLTSAHFVGLVFIPNVVTSDLIYSYKVQCLQMLETLCLFFPDTSAIKTSLVPAVWSQWRRGQRDLYHYP